MAMEAASSDMDARVENLNIRVKTWGFTLQFLLAQRECASGETPNIRFLEAPKLVCLFRPAGTVAYTCAD
jgi:hypothetical protein